MERRLLAILVPLLICCGLSSAVSADRNVSPATASASAKDNPEVFWQAGESYQGGAQYDARLDKPVRIWRAGIPLRELLAELTQQTGVGFDFLDPRRDEPRICVTLYLNPQESPSLRRVMAQLSWITHCSFAYHDPTVENRTYYLLWSSLGGGTAESVAAEAVARRDQFRTDMEARRDSRREATAAAFKEAKAALALSQEEAVVRYRGVNDALLLNLLDPSRRAGLSFLAGLPETEAKQLLDGESDSISRPWSAWSAEQQASLYQSAGGIWSLWPPDDAEVSVSIRRGRGGEGALSVTVETEQGRRVVGRTPGLLESGEVRGREQAVLQRYLGETRTPEQEEAAREQQRENRAATREERREEAVQRRADAEAATRTLTPKREAELASLTPSEMDGSASLWRLQEAVAKATGMNVVSDCFWPPRGGFGPRRGGPAQATENALDRLSRACLGLGGGFGPTPGFAGSGGEDLGMEWSDAGSFLRFRSRRPDIWRAALLPAKALAQLDGWLEPFATAESASPRPGAGVLSDDLTKLSWLAGRLDDLQVRLGGSIPYEDPAEPMAERLQTLRRTTLQQVARDLPLLRLTATFTPEQWERVKGDGLRWSSGLTPEQQESSARILAGRVPEDRMSDVVIRLGQTEARTIRQRDGTERTIPSNPALNILLDGTAIGQIAFGGWAGRGGGRGGPRGGLGGGPPA